MDRAVLDNVRQSASDSRKTSRNRRKLLFRIFALVALVVAANWAIAWMIMRAAASAPMCGSSPCP